MWLSYSDSTYYKYYLEDTRIIVVICLLMHLGYGTRYPEVRRFYCYLRCLERLGIAIHVPVLLLLVATSSFLYFSLKNRNHLTQRKSVRLLCATSSSSSRYRGGEFHGSHTTNSDLQKRNMRQNELMSKALTFDNFEHGSFETMASPTSLIDRRVSGQSYNSPRSLSLDNRKATWDSGQSLICKMFRKNFSLLAVSFALLRAYSGFSTFGCPAKFDDNSSFPYSALPLSWAVFTTLASKTRVTRPMVVCWRNSVVLRLRTIPLMRVSRCLEIFWSSRRGRNDATMIGESRNGSKRKSRFSNLWRESL